MVIGADKSKPINLKVEPVHKYNMYTLRNNDHLSSRTTYVKVIGMKAIIYQINKQYHWLG